MFDCLTRRSSDLTVRQSEIYGVAPLICVLVCCEAAELLLKGLDALTNDKGV